jgi:hypothetical protein
VKRAFWSAPVDWKLYGTTRRFAMYFHRLLVLVRNADHSGSLCVAGSSKQKIVDGPSIRSVMPRLPSLRRMVRAGFFESNFTALNPWPVMWLSEDPTFTLSQYLNDRYFLPASNSAASCSGGVAQPARDSPTVTGVVSGAA